MKKNKTKNAFLPTMALIKIKKTTPVPTPKNTIPFSAEDAKPQARACASTSRLELKNPRETPQRPTGMSVKPPSKTSLCSGLHQKGEPPASARRRKRTARWREKGKAGGTLL